MKKQLSIIAVLFCSLVACGNKNSGQSTQAASDTTQLQVQKQEGGLIGEEPPFEKCDTCIYLSDTTEVRQFIKKFQQAIKQDDTAKIMDCLYFPFDYSQEKMIENPAELLADSTEYLGYVRMTNSLLAISSELYAYPGTNLLETELTGQAGRDYEASNPDKNIFRLDNSMGSKGGSLMSYQCCCVVAYGLKSRNHASGISYTIKRRQGNLKIVQWYVGDEP